MDAQHPAGRPHLSEVRCEADEMIDIRKLKELIRLMVANDLTELDLRDDQEQVTLRRPGPEQEESMSEERAH